MKLPAFLDFAFILSALPPQELPEPELVVEHEDFRLSLLAPRTTGLPYRPLGYLLLAFVGSESARRQTRELGSSLSKLCKFLGAPELSESPASIEDQLSRLAQVVVKLEIAGKKATRIVTFPLFSQLVLDFQEPGASRKWHARISGDFYRILRHTAPTAIPRL